MEKRLTVFIPIMIFFPVYMLCQDKYIITQKKLDDIKKEMEAKTKEYDEYMKKYNELVSMMKKLKESQKDYLSKKNEYQKMIDSLKVKINENRRQYDALITLQNELKEKTYYEIKNIYLSRFSSPFFYDRYYMIKDIIRRNLIIEKKRMVDVIEHRKKVFKESILDLSKKNERLEKEKKETEKAIVTGEKLMKDKEKDLYITDAKLKRLKEEIDNLNRTARELTSLIKEFEKKSPYRKDKNLSVSLSEKSLPWPCVGNVINRFGKEYISDLKTWIINDGIKIKTDSSVVVKPVMSGKVIYSGRFRGFGNIVLVEHDNGIFTTYGFLSEIYVKTGDNVDVFSDIGRVGRDERDFREEEKDSNILYFEIRKGDVPLDPLIYLK